MVAPPVAESGPVECGAEERVLVDLDTDSNVIAGGSRFIITQFGAGTHELARADPLVVGDRYELGCPHNAHCRFPDTDVPIINPLFICELLRTILPGSAPEAVIGRRLVDVCHDVGLVAGISNLIQEGKGRV